MWRQLDYMIPDRVSRAERMPSGTLTDTAGTPLSITSGSSCPPAPVRSRHLPIRAIRPSEEEVCRPSARSRKYADIPRIGPRTSAPRALPEVETDTPCLSPQIDVLHWNS